MNGWDILLIILIAAAVIFAVIKIRRDRRSGRSCTGCKDSCEGCSQSCPAKKHTEG